MEGAASINSSMISGERERMGAAKRLGEGGQD